jgi:hypothetical protein
VKNFSVEAPAALQALQPASYTSAIAFPLCSLCASVVFHAFHAFHALYISLKALKDTIPELTYISYANEKQQL